jgi:hypothetical protein
MAVRIDVMTTLCSAFGVFSAFGVAILAFFTGGGGLQRLSSWMVRRRKEKANLAGADADARAMTEGHAVVWLVAGVVALVVLISGVGLFTSFFWLVAVAHASQYLPSWSYNVAEDMFYTEAVVVTVITVIAIIGTALAALPNSKTTAT